MKKIMLLVLMILLSPVFAANYYLQTSQNWSTSTWYDAASGGNVLAGLPGVNDTIIVTTTKILTIDTNNNPINVTAITGSGTGTIAIDAAARDGLTITAGSITGGTGGVLITITGVGTINFNVPQITGGGSGNYIMTNADGAIVNISGSVTSTSSGHGINNITTGIINIGGNVLENGLVGATNSGTGTINVAGNVTATLSSALSNDSTGTINVSGKVTGGTNADSYAIKNINAGGVVYIHEAVFATGRSIPFGGLFTTGKLRVDKFTVLGTAYQKTHSWLR
jgi:hypothetical protein